VTAVRETHLPGIELRNRGKVRDIYEVGGKLLIVVTDRISAFDVILPTGIPDKGKVLTQISNFWFDRLEPLVPNHLLEREAASFPDPLPSHRDVLDGRSVLVRKADIFPVECVARGYISGSGWKEYQETGEVCGIKLPEGLRESDRLPEPIFTPATKATDGHDENISFDRMVGIVGGEAAETLRDLTLRLYAEGSAYAETKGIIIADTKFEFGLEDGRLLLCDEALTPDSSRFWPMDRYEPGRSQPSFDKQFVRDHLLTLDWDKTPPGPVLPDEVVEGARERYLEIYRILTGRDLLAG
jgi:phosphoribosylaminoimidazole-succinocarboxamide synthase